MVKFYQKNIIQKLQELDYQGVLQLAADEGMRITVDAHKQVSAAPQFDDCFHVASLDGRTAVAPQRLS